MAIHLKYTYFAKEASEAATFNRMIVEALQSRVSRGVLVTPEAHRESARGPKYWDAEVRIHLADGNSDPADESAEARRLADAMGAPWEKMEDGSRVLAPGTGGFSSDFSLMTRAEMKLEERKSFLGKLFG